MIRGTTPTLEFTLPFSVSQLQSAYVTFAQNKRVVFEKCLTDCECNENVLCVRLTQDDTLRLCCIYDTEIQIRAKTQTGDAIASEIIRVKTETILKDGEI